jgi:L-alanine-DL-glutamate epimerase-like enolase superfamily enzyme
MPDIFPLGLSRDMAVHSLRSTIVDVPTARRHKLSNTSISAQSYVIVQVQLENGAEGIGEAATLGGPRWSEESVEAIKANIDTCLAPALHGQRADLIEAAGLRMDQAAKRNNAAKAAIETALWDAVGVAAHLQAFATLRELAWGCEHFGPRILVGDLVTEPLQFEEFNIHLPTDPGIGVTLDADRMRAYART